MSQRRLLELEELFMKGSVTRARAGTLALARRRVPREQLWRLAYLLRRLELPEKAIRLLRRFVRPRGRQACRATHEEISEYAMALGFLGAKSEALELLAGVDAEAYPRALIYRAILLAMLREYDATIPLLARFLERGPGHRSIGEYDLESARLRLGLARVLGESSGPAQWREARARALGEAGRADSWNGRFALLVAALAALRLERWQDARATLEKLRRRATAAGDPPEHWNVDFWLALVSLKTGRKAALASLARIRRREAARGNWEHVRRIDLHRAEHLGERATLLELAFGTPHVSLRQRAIKALGGAGAQPEQFELRLGGAGPAPCRLVLREAARAAGPVLARLLELLTEDLYCPRSLAELHAGLYPRQHYDPLTSPERVHRAIRRLRAWLRSQRLPLDVAVAHGLYRITASEPCVLVLARRDQESAASGLAARVRELVHELGRRFGPAPFSAREAARAAGVSTRSAVNHLRAAHEAGLLARDGAGRSTRYRLRPRSPSLS